MDLQTALNELLEKASWAEEYSVEQSDIYLQALRMAELLQDAKQTDTIRGHYIDCLNFQDRTEEAFPHFSMLLNRLDAPDTNWHFYEKMSILWKYKWFMGALPGLPNISKAQIFDVMNDMERRYLEYNVATQATIYYAKAAVYRALGDPKTADSYGEKYEATKTTDISWVTLSNCNACIQDSDVDDALSAGQWEQALEMAQPILAGDKKCESVPDRTYFKVALALAKMGRMDDAAHYFEKGVQLLKADRVNLDRHRRGICYLVYTGQWERALAIFEQNFSKTLSLLDKLEVFHFYAASLLLFRSIARTQPQVNMQLPDNSLLYQPDGLYQTAEVVQTLHNAVQEIAAQFDQRNENDYYSRVLLAFYDWFMPEG